MSPQLATVFVPDHPPWVLGVDPGAATGLVLIDPDGTVVDASQVQGRFVAEGDAVPVSAVAPISTAVVALAARMLARVPTGAPLVVGIEQTTSPKPGYRPKGKPGGRPGPPGVPRRVAVNAHATTTLTAMLTAAWLARGLTVAHVWPAARDRDTGAPECLKRYRPREFTTPTRLDDPVPGRGLRRGHEVAAWTVARDTQRDVMRGRARLVGADGVVGEPGPAPVGAPARDDDEAADPGTGPAPETRVPTPVEAALDAITDARPETVGALLAACRAATGGWENTLPLDADVTWGVVDLAAAIVEDGGVPGACLDDDGRPLMGDALTGWLNVLAAALAAAETCRPDTPVDLLRVVASVLDSFGAGQATDAEHIDAAEAVIDAGLGPALPGTRQQVRAGLTHLHLTKKVGSNGN